MDTAQWITQANSDPRHLVNEMGMAAKPSLQEEMVPCGPAGAAACSARAPQMMERKPRPQREKQVLSCPRCQSTNTKFCYYNNYSLTQPRYFCKTCRRYWTEGGSLRNVPVGGGSRKNKRPASAVTTKTSTPSSTSTPTSSQLSTSSGAASAAKNKLPLLMPGADHLAPPPAGSSTSLIQGQDLNLAFPPQAQHMNGSSLGEYPTVESSSNAGANPASTTAGSFSAMEFLRTGLSAHGAPSPFMPMMAAAAEAAGVPYPSVFGLQDFRSTSLGFSLDGIAGGGGGYSNVVQQGVVQEGAAGGGRVFFPYEDLRQVSSTPAEIIEQQSRVQGPAGDPSGFWNGVMGGGAGSW